MASDVELSLRITRDHREALKERAAALETTVEDLVRQALDQFLAHPPRPPGTSPSARELLGLSEAERDRILERAAKVAYEDYVEDHDLTSFDAS